jgi:hypothetical protein
MPAGFSKNNFIIFSTQQELSSQKFPELTLTPAFHIIIRLSAFAALKKIISCPSSAMAAQPICNR